MKASTIRVSLDLTPLINKDFFRRINPNNEEAICRFFDQMLGIIRYSKEKDRMSIILTMREWYIVSTNGSHHGTWQELFIDISTIVDLFASNYGAFYNEIKKSSPTSLIPMRYVDGVLTIMYIDIGLREVLGGMC